MPCMASPWLMQAPDAAPGTHTHQVQLRVHTHQVPPRIHTLTRCCPGYTRSPGATPGTHTHQMLPRVHTLTDQAALIALARAQVLCDPTLPAHLCLTAQAVHYGVFPGATSSSGNLQSVLAVVRPHNWQPKSTKEVLLELDAQSGGWPSGWGCQPGVRLGGGGAPSGVPWTGDCWPSSFLPGLGLVLGFSCHWV